MAISATRSRPALLKHSVWTTLGMPSDMPLSIEGHRSTASLRDIHNDGTKADSQFIRTDG
ncbi:hypothetical protein DS909_18690 [Phaeobacter gallaeciensis]|uniref:Uncharacterized protein n=1 Tax=Phaeobacter gallaeciensis TaxID=60890 RepID=A0A366WR45_9RHOB|nr:hypothetical protein DS909_18690 [Phaeobacter gallaeciensis]